MWGKSKTSFILLLSGLLFAAPLHSKKTIPLPHEALVTNGHTVVFEDLLSLTDKTVLQVKRDELFERAEADIPRSLARIEALLRKETPDSLEVFPFLVHFHTSVVNRIAILKQHSLRV